MLLRGGGGIAWKELVSSIQKVDVFPLVTREIRGVYMLVDGAPEEAGSDKAGQHFGANHGEPCCSSEARERLNDVGGESSKAA